MNPQSLFNYRLAISYLLVCSYSQAVRAQDSSSRFSFHFQTTYIYQYKPHMRSAYEGGNSLMSEKEDANSITATIYAGAKLWRNAEFYLNPEVSGGSGLSSASGMGGSTNGEAFRIGTAEPRLYLARGYLRQTIPLGNQAEWQEDDDNQVAVSIPANRLNFYLGKLSLSDLFDKNEYANSPRTQFMNWALMNNGAWDYAANTRGYTYTFISELKLNRNYYRVALATLPTTANGPDLNINFKDSFSLAVNAEAAFNYSYHGRPGNIRALIYYNEANMGNWKQSTKGTGVPDIKSTRTLGRTKWGLGLNADQELSDWTGIFARLGWNDGINETWAFTEIDRTLTTGLAFQGSKWKRSHDQAGIALVVNGLSADHRNYLKRGGLDFMLGDGNLSYRKEMILEYYYCWEAAKIPVWLTADYQLCFNPGYNHDRGPANVFSLRVHTHL